MLTSNGFALVFELVLLLPPLLPSETCISVKSLIEPLIERAKARANLQGRNWYGPSKWPLWMEAKSISEGVIAEIVANLLENAFRYSPPKASIGIEVIEEGICIWDQGTPIKEEEREKIFQVVESALADAYKNRNKRINLIKWEDRFWIKDWETTKLPRIELSLPTHPHAC